jgi:glycosyltransferase involved in cell wall biosynthesis
MSQVMKRILFVSHTGALGGAEFVLMDIAQHCRERCHVALLADGPLRGALEAKGVAVSTIAASEHMLGVRRDASWWRSLRAVPATLSAAWRLARLARGYDMLFATSQKAGVLAMIAGRLAGRPVIWQLHDIVSAAHFAGLQRRVSVVLANVAVRTVLANSEASRLAFCAAGGRHDRVRVLPVGIDPAPFLAVTDEQVEARRAALVPPGVTLIGLFGRLAPWKGQDVLIDALPALPGVHAVFVGDALFGEAGFRESLHARAASAGVEARVTWLGFRDDVAELMRAVDIVVHTSKAPEPFGRVIVEAMLAQRPVIATRGGATAEILGEDYPYLVTPDDPCGLAGAVRRVMALDAPQAAGLVAANFSRATGRFSLDAMLEAVDPLIA